MYYTQSFCTKNSSVFNWYRCVSSYLILTRVLFQTSPNHLRPVTLIDKKHMQIHLAIKTLQKKNVNVPQFRLIKCSPEGFLFLKVIL